MYKRHNIWDEDKWDIHKSESKYAGGSGSGYAGHGPKDGASDYHKNDIYGTKGAAEKLKDDYKSANNAEEDKDKDKEKEKDTIADRIAEEEKKEEKQHQEEEGFFKSIKSEFRPEHMQQKEITKKSKKHHSSIEEAISKAIKEEKKTIFID